MLAFPGGAGYGKASLRDPDLVKRDLVHGYISAEAAIRDYGLTAQDVAQILTAVKHGSI